MSDAYPGMEWRLEKAVVPVAKTRDVNVHVKTVEVPVDEGLQKKKRGEA